MVYTDQRFCDTGEPRVCPGGKFWSVCLGGHSLHTKLIACWVQSRWCGGMLYLCTIWGKGRGLPEEVSNNWARLVKPCEAHMENATYCCICGNRGCLRMGRCQDTSGDKPNFFLIYLQARTVSHIHKFCFRNGGRDHTVQHGGLSIWAYHLAFHLIVGVSWDLCYPV